ncbi:hypothetical protein GCM10027416_01520 [Okibacterium endophyticum]
MYGALWRALPGPFWVRLIIMLVLIAAVLVALFTWVFPLVETLVFSPDVTVEE